MQKTTWDDPATILSALIQSGVADNGKTVPSYWEPDADSPEILTVFLQSGDPIHVDRATNVFMPI